MQLSFKHVCPVGVVFPDGALSTLHFGAGEGVAVVHPRIITLENKTHQDFEMEDGTILVNVPLNAVQVAYVQA